MLVRSRWRSSFWGSKGLDVKNDSSRLEKGPGSGTDPEETGSDKWKVPVSGRRNCVIFLAWYAPYKSS